MLKVAVTGCAGRMGREITDLVSRDEDMKIAGMVERKGHPLVGQDLIGPDMAGNPGPIITDNLREIIGGVDVVIDFTTPESSMEHYKIVAGAGKGIVIGTTGFSAEQLKTMENYRDKAACVRSPNMSIGVNVMFKLVSEAAKMLANYDMEITEIHHKLKKDAPSGTAMRLAEILARETSRDLSKVGVYGRRGMVGERKPGEIGVMSLRMSDVVGEHTVYFGGHGERLEITHRASSRMNFAAGAVLAAGWLAGKKKGMYDMQDVLGL
ncbi:MAG: 4-hydroxy-tetrahydrodipicolinate reductase [Nitrospinae bacterium]|nr:4-hydroxy-tetrahydrodipicolinate reductase [Nitrospinota bacterium]